tara:strand:+ start:1137 stop:1748 length:612 start_codon:yes stop_codon:yes gene_type:complete
METKTAKELVIEQIKITDLKEAEYNPRELTGKQYEDLKNSLTEFGFVDPVLVNTHHERSNVIIGGHQRVKVWADLGNDFAPCVKLHLDYEKEKELNVRLNKNTGQFDKEALINFFDQEQLIEWGFEEWEFGINEDIDYSILDDEDLSEEIDDMQANVKKAIQIEFEAEHYEEASEIVRWWRDQEGYVGGMILEYLKAEKEKLI